MNKDELPKQEALRISFRLEQRRVLMIGDREVILPIEKPIENRFKDIWEAVEDRLQILLRDRDITMRKQ